MSVQNISILHTMLAIVWCYFDVVRIHVGNYEWKTLLNNHIYNIAHLNMCSTLMRHQYIMDYIVKIIN